jgi:hypothetical protein
VNTADGVGRRRRPWRIPPGSHMHPSYRGEFCFRETNGAELARGALCTGRHSAHRQRRQRWLAGRRIAVSGGGGGRNAGGTDAPGTGARPSRETGPGPAGAEGSGTRAYLARETGPGPAGAEGSGTGADPGRVPALGIARVDAGGWRSGGARPGGRGTGGRAATGRRPLRGGRPRRPGRRPGCPGRGRGPSCRARPANWHHVAPTTCDFTNRHLSLLSSRGTGKNACPYITSVRARESRC